MICDAPNSTYIEYDCTSRSGKRTSRPKLQPILAVAYLKIKLQDIYQTDILKTFHVPFSFFQISKCLAPLFSLQHKQQVAYSKPSHLAQRDDPWNRLSLTGTLSSSRKEAGYFDPEAPGDSLDFVLKTEYNQHREFDKGKSETVLQKETVGKPHKYGLVNNNISTTVNR